jgi:hypothetical protein
MAQLFHWTNPRAAIEIQRVGEIRPALSTRLSYEPVVWLTENPDPLISVAEGRRMEHEDAWIRFGVEVANVHPYEWWRRRQSREMRRLIATVKNEATHEWWVTLRPIPESHWVEISTVTFGAKKEKSAGDHVRRKEEEADEPSRNRPNRV